MIHRKKPDVVYNEYYVTENSQHVYIMTIKPYRNIYSIHYVQWMQIRPGGHHECALLTT